MERRFRIRLDELLEDAEVPDGLRGVDAALGIVSATVSPSIACGRTKAQCPAIRFGTDVGPGQQGR